MREANDRSQVVIVTGGLGPTKDDITKHTFCAYFEDKLVEDGEVLKHIEHLFEKYISTPISDMNRQQALVPSKAVVLKNQFGTAPGMWMEKEGTVFVSLPGVPFEMKGLMTHSVVPKIMERFERHNHLRGRAIRVRDDVLVGILLHSLRVHFRNNERDLRIVAVKRGVIDHNTSRRRGLGRKIGRASCRERV